MKVLINKCFGGFGLSKEAIHRLNKLGFTIDDIWDIDHDDKLRADPKLIAVIEELGLTNSSGDFALLKIVTIPDDIEFIIENYDGVETVHEKHKIWD